MAHAGEVAAAVPLAALTIAAASAVLALTSTAGAQVLPPSANGECVGQVPIVVASDAEAQADLYSATTLAGALDTRCIVLAGARDAAMPPAQRARLDAASDTGWIVGGAAAVPQEKVAGRSLKRLAGVDRWHTARLVGAIAASPDEDVADLRARTAPPAAAQLTAVDVGGNHSCALRDDRTVTCWGDNRYGQSDPPPGEFVSLSVGEYHSCGVHPDGVLACWGNDEHGQANQPPGSYAAVTAGWGHSCALRHDGSVTCWGDDVYGQLAAPPGEFAEISAGALHTCGRHPDGVLACW